MFEWGKNNFSSILSAAVGYTCQLKLDCIYTNFFFEARFRCILGMEMTLVTQNADRDWHQFSYWVHCSIVNSICDNILKPYGRYNICCTFCTALVKISCCCHSPYSNEMNIQVLLIFFKQMCHVSVSSMFVPDSWCSWVFYLNLCLSVESVGPQSLCCIIIKTSLPSERLQGVNACKICSATMKRSERKDLDNGITAR